MELVNLGKISAVRRGSGSQCFLVGVTDERAENPVKKRGADMAVTSSCRGSIEEIAFREAAILLSWCMEDKGCRL